MSPSGVLVALALPRPAGARAVVAAWEAGEAVLPLDADAPAPELAAVLAAARPTHLVDGDGRRALPGGLPVEAGVAAVVATSGTGGAPKLVELGADAIAWSAMATTRSLDAGPGDRWLCCVPTHGVAGLAVVARAWHSGLPVEVHDRFDPAAVADAAGRATLVSLVPAQLRRLLAAGDDAARFRRVLLGGGPIPADLAAEATTRGVHLVRTYGLTETFGGMAHDGHPLDGVEVRTGGLWTADTASSSAGLPSRAGAPQSGGSGATVPGGSGSTVPGGSGSTVPGGSGSSAAGGSGSSAPGGAGGPGDGGAGSGAPGGPEGELLVRGPMLFRRYRGDPARTAAVLRDGWLHTGDLGRIGPDGRVTVLGRRDDLVITGGVNVHPDEVEAVLATHPQVAEAAVAGRADPEWGQRVVAFVVPKRPDHPPTLDDLRRYARQRLAPAKAPRELVLVPALPRTASGKLLRRLLPDGEAHVDAGLGRHLP